MTTRTQVRATRAAVRTTLLSLGSLVALAGAAVPAIVACGGSTPPAASPSSSVGQTPPGAYPGYPQQPGAYPQQPVVGAYPQQPQQPGAYPQQPGAGGYPQQPQQGVPPGATAAAPSAAPAPLGSVVTTNPNDLASIFAQAAAAGQALLQQPGAVPGDPLEAGLKAASAKHAAGEQLQGQIAKATLQEGAHNAFMVTMQPGTCYTIIGFSPAGQVKNVDLHLLAPPFYNVLAGQDTTDNNTPVIGGSPNAMCPVIPLPLQYKVDITARSGSGVVGVGVYTKSK